MAPSVSASQAYGFADGNAGHVCTFTAGAPTVGDWDVLCVNSDTTVSTPSGFTLNPSRVNFQGAYIFRRKAAGGEGATVTVTTTGDHPAHVIWVRLSGADAADVVAVNGGDGSSFTTTPALSSGALAASGEIGIAFAALHSFTTIPASLVWGSSYTAVTSGNQGTGATAPFGAVAYKTPVGTAAEAPGLSWTNATNDAYMLFISFTAAVGGASIAPDGISVPVTLGSPTLTWSATVAPDGIAVPVALGAPTLADGSMAVGPTGVPVPVVLGDPALSWTGSIAPDGIAVPVVLGAPIVGAVAVNPDGISVPVVLGDPALSWSATAAPDGIAVPVSLGSPALALPGIAPDGISVPVALGSPVLAWSGTVSPNGISVPVSLGAPGVGVPVVVANGSSTATVTSGRSSAPGVASSVTSTSTVGGRATSTPTVSDG